MAVFTCNFYASTLGTGSTMTVILPEQAALRRRKVPVLFLLHGLLDDHSIWLRRTSIERYAEQLNVAIVMPSGGRSFYTNMAHGYRYWDFISDELPALARAFFPLSEKREETFVAGLSMGGYGALKLALAQPERYAAVAGLSSAVRAFMDDDDRTGEWYAEMEDVFGPHEQFAGSHHDLATLATAAAAGPGPAPRIYLACGQQDFLYADNIALRDHLHTLPLALRWEEGPGDHSWAYWDAEIQKVLAWLPLRKLPVKQ